MALETTNMQNFWQEIWDKQQTGWKVFEPKDHHRKVFRNRLMEGCQAMMGLQMKTKEAEVPAFDASTYTQERPLRILVPLCGDSPILTYLIGDDLLADFPQELSSVPIEVVGIDLAKGAFSSVFDYCSKAGWGDFKGASVCGKSEEGEASAVVAESFTLLRNRDRRLTLVAGDFFEVMKSPQVIGQGFDIVWDRAAVVALPPTLRIQYTKTVETVLLLAQGRGTETRGPMPFPYRGIFLEAVRREGANKLAGPPFHINPIAVETVAEWPKDLGKSLSHDPDLLTLKFTHRIVCSGEVIDPAAARAGQLEMVNGEENKLPPFTFHSYVIMMKTS